MRRVGAFIAAIARAIDIEGAFFAVGVACIAIASAYIVFWGPWIVVGTACIIVGVALSLPDRTERR